MVRRLLVPTDFSAPAQAATRWAFGLARALDAELTLLHVYEVVGMVPVVRGHHSYEQWMALAAEADLELSAIAAEGEALGVRVHKRTRHGLLAREILQEIRDGGHDLVVMGTHARAGLPRALEGSATERVIHHSPCPVLTLGPKALTPHPPSEQEALPS